MPSNDSLYQEYLQGLTKSPYGGEIKTDLATRLCMATDNSIYQVLPQAVLFPKTTEDIQQIFFLAQQSKFHQIQFSARGGGTGTNGQSLTNGIIIDCSKYLNKILDINCDEMWVELEPGVILDQLNEVLKPKGVFFAPSLAPSNRATLGGMVSTDASGKGSPRYGKTSEHVLAIEAVLSDGTLFHCHANNSEAVAKLSQQDNRQGKFYKTVADIVTQKQALINRQFPKLDRFMTGYNLAKAYDPENKQFNLNYILSGSEGTLCTLSKLRLRLTPLPKVKTLIVINYKKFQDALEFGKELLAFKPEAIETIDDKIINLAKTDEIYGQVKAFLHEQTAGINLVEFSGQTKEEIASQLQGCIKAIEQSECLAYHVTDLESEMKSLWSLRKKGVGLLGNLPGQRRPIPFVEDTVVPPEHLPSYIKEFCALLDSYHLQYGLFGHVDAGCLHVRPALDMTDPNDAKLVKEITDQVILLVKKYNGILWGEHGKGYRSEHVKTFFGDELYEDLRRIKASLDPYNQLNPGKIATPLGSDATIVNMQGPLRGEFDRQIPKAQRQHYPDPLFCNGNGACFNYQSTDVMCPSYKITQDRIHSPKGRATVMREWLRREAKEIKSDFPQEVYAAMSGCLGCKACASSCPIHVDVPAFKASFLYHYYQQRRRPLRDFFVARIEKLLPWQSRHGFLFNVLNNSRIYKNLMKLFLKVVDIPRLSYPPLSKSEIQFTTLADLKKLPATDKEKAVIIIQDPFTSFYEAELIITSYQLLTKLGFQVYVLPFRPNGKALHNLGYLDEFKKLAQANSHYLADVATLNIPMIGMDASTVLCYRDEYKKTLQKQDLGFTVQLIQEWLATQLKHIKTTKLPTQQSYYLLSHCTEKALVQHSQDLWQTIFSHFNLELKPIAIGCCGMAGLYGHEQEHLKNSRGIYALSWETILEKYQPQQLLATGYSCRSQVKRFSEVSIEHPLGALFKLLS